MNIENKIRQAWNRNKLFFILALLFIVYGIYNYNQPVPTQTQSIFDWLGLGTGIFGGVALIIGLVILGLLLFGGLLTSLPGAGITALIGLVTFLFFWGSISVIIGLLVSYWYIGIIVLVIYILLKR